MDLRRGRPARSRVPRRLRPLLDPAALRYWAAVIALAALLAGIVGRTVASAERSRDAWGSRRTVLVAARTLEAGDALGPAEVRSVRWPAELVPPEAVSTLPDEVRARGPIGAGAPITADVVAAPDEGPPPGARTIAIAVDERSLPVKVGQRVDLWSVPDGAIGADGAVGAERVAIDALVLDASEAVVVVAVRSAQVADAAEAVATAHVVLVGTP